MQKKLARQGETETIRKLGNQPVQKTFQQHLTQTEPKKSTAGQVECPGWIRR